MGMRMKLERDVNNSATRREGAARSGLWPVGRFGRVAAFVGCVAGLGGVVGVGCADTGSDGAGGQGSSGGKAAEAVGAADQALTAAPILHRHPARDQRHRRRLADCQQDSPKNYGTSAAMVTGLVSGEERESLVRFDLSAIPAGATINSAIFSAYNTNNAQSDIRLHRVTAPWIESTVTWQSFNAAYVPAQEFTFSNLYNPASTNKIVDLVQSWVNGTNPNYGFLLREPSSARRTRSSSRASRRRCPSGRASTCASPSPARPDSRTATTTRGRLRDGDHHDHELRRLRHGLHDAERRSGVHGRRLRGRRLQRGLRRLRWQGVQRLRNEPDDGDGLRRLRPGLQPRQRHLELRQRHLHAPRLRRRLLRLRR